MPSAEVDRKRRRLSTHKSQSSRSRKEHKNDESGATAHPLTVEELRKARLDYIEAPTAGRQSKMKYEYIKTVPVKVKVSTSESRHARASSTVSKTTNKVTSKRRRTARTEDLAASENANDDQYVYRAERRRVQGSEHDRRGRGTTAEGSTRKVDRRSPVEESHPPAVVRRHTTPVTSRLLGERLDLVSSPASRPRLRKSSTAARETSRPALGRSDASWKTRTEVSIAQSTVAANRKSSVFGSLFSTKPAPPEKKVSCLTCGDDVSVARTAKLPCTHRMCHACLKRIFKLSVTDPAHMPPRCCTDRHIDLKHVDSLFDDDFKKNWNRKFKEYKAKNRIYCPARGCGQWIQPKHISIDRGRKIGKCSTCKTLVCGICSQKMHKSKDCPKDPATKAFVEVAKKQGWQKCYSCSAMVELKEGCNHMTCRCTAEFCMVCAQKWKSCDCPWFSYQQVDVSGNPIRFQEEMDRRRDQELQDEELARRMEMLDTDNDGAFNMFNIGNAAARHINATFIQQAREALTANYQQADQVARGLLNGIFVERGNTLLDPAEVVTTTPNGVPVMRHRTRRRSALQDLGDERVQTTAQREQVRRMRNWANDIPE